ncbi:hypothetical protein HDU91_001163 [Kappamyces sp. JEL0680]|nr:hypothetical protein HDU91_001163 [Kappamyces sp. JEL0680]
MNGISLLATLYSLQDKRLQIAIALPALLCNLLAQSLAIIGMALAVFVQSTSPLLALVGYDILGIGLFLGEVLMLCASLINLSVLAKFDILDPARLAPHRLEKLRWMIILSFACLALWNAVDCVFYAITRTRIDWIHNVANQLGTALWGAIAISIDNIQAWYLKRLVKSFKFKHQLSSATIQKYEQFVHIIVFACIFDWISLGVYVVNFALGDSSFSHGLFNTALACVGIHMLIMLRAYTFLADFATSKHELQPLSTTSARIALTASIPTTIEAHSTIDEGRESLG